MAVESVMSVTDRALVDCYGSLLAVVHTGELDPFQHRNAIKALAALWQIANGILPSIEHPHDIAL